MSIMTGAQPSPDGTWNVLPPSVLSTADLDRQDATDLHRWRSFDFDWQVFDRVRTMNVLHAEAAWKRRFHRPLGAYGLAFLFQQPATTTAGTARVTMVTAATRLWLAGPEAENLTPLLAKLEAQTRGRDPRAPWDLREQIANRHDEAMSDDAIYIGLGVSSLDTYTGTWPQVLQCADSILDIPGTIRIISANPAVWEDQRVVVADRRAANDHATMTIHSHRALSTHLMSSPYPYGEAPLGQLYNDPQHGHILQWMRALHLALADADQDRRTTALTRRESRRRPS